MYLRQCPRVNPWLLSAPPVTVSTLGSRSTPRTSLSVPWRTHSTWRSLAPTTSLHVELHWWRDNPKHQTWTVPLMKTSSPRSGREPSPCRKVITSPILTASRCHRAWDIQDAAEQQHRIHLLLALLALQQIHQIHHWWTTAHLHHQHHDRGYNSSSNRMREKDWAGHVVMEEEEIVGKRVGGILW